MNSDIELRHHRVVDNMHFISLNGLLEDYEISAASTEAEAWLLAAQILHQLAAEATHEHRNLTK